MNALPSPSQYPPPERSPRRQPRRGGSAPAHRRAAQPGARSHPHRQRALELGAKLGVNAIAILAATSGLCRLVPFYLSRDGALQQLESEVSGLESRVDALQTEFRTHFDPANGVNTMRETTGRLSPNQRYLFLPGEAETVPGEGRGTAPSEVPSEPGEMTP